MSVQLSAHSDHVSLFLLLLCFYFKKSQNVSDCVCAFVWGGRGGPGVLVLNAGMADWLTQKRQINSLRRNLERRERPIYLSRNEEGEAYPFCK